MIQITLTPAQNNWLEVSWADVVDESKTEIKFVSYHPTQLSLLEADAALMGTSLDDHAQMLADWVAAYVPPPPEPVAVPRIVTMRQARLALLGAGKLADVNNAINALPSTGASRLTNPLCRCTSWLYSHSIIAASLVGHD